MVLGGIGNAFAMLLNGAQVMRFQVIVASTMAIANVVLSILLTQRIGVAGVVWGSVIAFSIFDFVPVVLYLPRLFARLEAVPTRT
jgi:Na+-driven multidrug efflux pump